MPDQNAQILEYRHPYFCDDWEQIEWRSGPEELAQELAEDWVEDEEDEAEARRIAEDIAIRVVNPRGNV